MRRLKERLTFANVTASLALFIALGGTSYAAITLPRNSVGTNQLRTGAIRSVDVKDRSLEARDLSLNARRFLKGQKGERGERGPQGPAGDASGGSGPEPGHHPGGHHADGRPRPAQRLQRPDARIPVVRPTRRRHARRAVPPAAGSARPSAGDQVVISSFPVGGNAWQAEVGNYSTTGHDFTVYAICAS